MKLQLYSPCQENWDAMPGDDHTRRCARCAKPVHDLAALTPREAKALIARDPTPCMRLTRRRDGTLVTRLAAAALAVAGCGVEPATEPDPADAIEEVTADADSGHLLVAEALGGDLEVASWLANPPDPEHTFLIGSVRSLEFTRGDTLEIEEYESGDGM